MLSILPYHAMRFPCIIHYFYNILLSSEIYNCANTVGVGIIGDTSSASFYRSDSSFPYPVASTFILCYLFTLYYIFQ
ncbi:hypothetical protein COJ60_10510 [Bacillus cereus]|nr:hypothetical protein CK938_24415 [Bacillus cereus]OUA67535.1 hypothetical protein BK786_09380 [Bacillus thuringiensis serovar thailandensis]PNS30646.1 hypothetical protein C1640_19335 [Bacillus sp. AKBS9]PEF56997.1 hypothetical protein CON32_17240 [Bacillus cereus]PFN37681.1 hypothetical protein COJ60_10510 [Bacillus cereus]